MTPRSIPFFKAEACGNDFLIVDAAHMDSDPAELSRRLCNRHLGVGAGGGEWVSTDPQGRIIARLFNAGGSEAEISGKWNSVRCRLGSRNPQRLRSAGGNGGWREGMHAVAPWRARLRVHGRNGTRRGP